VHVVEDAMLERVAFWFAGGPPAILLLALSLLSCTALLWGWI
jgi:hypothetical protein